MRKLPGFSRRAVAIGDDRVLGLEDGRLLDLDSGRPVARIALQAPLVRAGWIERSRLLWASTDDGAIHFFDAGDGTLHLTLQTFPDKRDFAVAPGGRYDTNLGADTTLVRWVVPDAPWQSLAAQTFMRDYYEPGLYRRLLDCRANDTCASAFKPLPAIASLNRVLPRRASPACARVAMAPKRWWRSRSGKASTPTHPMARPAPVLNALFRNGRLVAMAPRQVDAAGTDLAQWRVHNAVKAIDGVTHLEFTVPLPTQAGEDAQESPRMPSTRTASRAKPRT